MSDTPDEIWLQWYGDQEPEDCVGEASEGEITWAQNEVFNADIKYVKSELFDRLKAENERLRSYLKNVKQCECHSCVSQRDALAATEGKDKGKTLVEIFGKEKE